MIRAAILDSNNVITAITLVTSLSGALVNCPDNVVGDVYDPATSTFHPPDVLLTDAQAAQVRALTQSCNDQILGGFVSSALGTPYTYPSGTLDQTNLMASVLASTLPGTSIGWVTPFWCQNPAGAWGFVAHTAAQIQQVGLDGKLMIVEAQLKLIELKTLVAAAVTDLAVGNVTW